MKINIGDKIVIINIGKTMVDVPIFKHNFSYRLNVGESLVFPITSIEQALFYLKQNNKILQVTIGNSNEETLTPFTIGQKIVGNGKVTFTNNYTLDEMKSIVSTVYNNKSNPIIALFYFDTNGNNGYVISTDREGDGQNIFVLSAMQIPIWASEAHSIPLNNGAIINFNGGFAESFEFSDSQIPSDLGMKYIKWDKETLTLSYQWIDSLTNMYLEITEIYHEEYNGTLWGIKEDK